MKTKYCKSFLTSFIFISFLSLGGTAQRVGIGTNNPLRKLAVTGSIMVDQNSNNTGTLDSAALVFGNAGIAGISSRQQGPDANSLTFWTGGVPYMNLSPVGDVGIGGGYNASYRLWVRNGHTRIGGDAYIDGNVSGDGRAAFGGDVDNDYRLRVWAGNTRLGGDMHATGNVAVGGDVDSLYRLRVIGGDTRLGGDMHATGNVGIGGLPEDNFRLKIHSGSTYLNGNLQVTGSSTMGSLGITGNISTTGTINAPNVNVTNSLTIDGKGSVRSNGPSPLRIGFDEKTVDILLAGGAATTVTASITDFSGTNDDVRVFVSQLRSNSGNTLSFAFLTVHVADVDAATNTCLITLRNNSNLNSTLKATIFLTTIAKN